MELNDSFLLDFCINADFLDNTIDYTDTLAQIESSQGENKEIVPTSNTVGQEIVKDMDNNNINKSENDTVKLDKRFKVIKDEEHKKILDNRIPANTRRNTNWGTKTYTEWAMFRNKVPETKADPKGKKICINFTTFETM